jgi:hypothetical protein
LNELDGDMRNPGVDTPGSFRYTRDLPGHPGTEDHSVLYLRLLYAWLPVLDDAGYRVPKLKTWDADWGGDPDLNDAERAITSQLENASPQQIRAYERAYSERKIGMRGPMGRAEEKFVTDHLSTPWKKTGEWRGATLAKRTTEKSGYTAPEDIRAMKRDALEASKRAEALSAVANRTDTASDHGNAFEAHFRASKAHQAAGNIEDAARHKQIAEKHGYTERWRSHS